MLLSPLAPLLCASGGGGGSVANPGDESGVGSVLKALHRQPSGTHALPLLLCSPPPPRAPSCAALRCGSLGWLRAAAGGRWCVGVGVLRLSQTRTTNNYHDDGITSSGGVVVNAGNRQILRTGSHTGLRRRANVSWSSSSGSCRAVLVAFLPLWLWPGALRQISGVPKLFARRPISASSAASSRYSLLLCRAPRLRRALLLAPRCAVGLWAASCGGGCFVIHGDGRSGSVLSNKGLQSAKLRQCRNSTLLAAPASASSTDTRSSSCWCRPRPFPRALGWLRRLWQPTGDVLGHQCFFSGGSSGQQRQHWYIRAPRQMLSALLHLWRLRAAAVGALLPPLL